MVANFIHKTIISFLFLFSIVLITACHTNSVKEKSSKPQDSLSTLNTNASPIVKKQIDSLVKYELKESKSVEDEIVNDYLTEELKPIRENFKRINRISEWTSMDEKELLETAEGGEARFYYTSDTLEKIITRQFGEMSQKVTEYYLLDQELSFVFEKSFQYNRPMYYDSTMMKENNDTEVLDIDKSEIVEERSYFVNGKLVHQVNNQDVGAPMADDYLAEEQIRIIDQYKRLIQIVNQD